MSDEIVSLHQHRAVVNKDNRGLKFDDLVDIVRKDGELERATAAIIILVETTPEGHVIGVLPYSASIHRTQANYAIDLVKQQYLQA
jgi:hypothetical protein